jgi:hypothetical protein
MARRCSRRWFCSVRLGEEYLWDRSEGGRGRKPMHQPSRMMTWRGWLFVEELEELGEEERLVLMGFQRWGGRRSPWPEKRALSYCGMEVGLWERREVRTDLRRGMS